MLSSVPRLWRDGSAKRTGIACSGSRSCACVQAPGSGRGARDGAFVGSAEKRFGSWSSERGEWEACEWLWSESRRTACSASITWSSMVRKAGAAGERSGSSGGAIILSSTRIYALIPSINTRENSERQTDPSTRDRFTLFLRLLTHTYTHLSLTSDSDTCAVVTLNAAASSPFSLPLVRLH